MARTPPFSAKVIAQFEAAIVKALNADEINADDEIAAKKMFRQVLFRLS
jgi:hypothetical protein